MKKSHQLVLGLATSGVFLYWSFSKANFSAMGTHFSQINYLWVIPFVILTMLTMAVRALRWSCLLRTTTAAGTDHLTGAQVWRPLMIGFAFNGIFPARAGEFARAWLVNRRHGVPLTGALATVVVERLYDLAMLCLVVAYLFGTLDLAHISAQVYDGRWSLGGTTVGVLLALAIAAPLVAWFMLMRRWRVVGGGWWLAYGCVAGAGISGLVMYFMSPVAQLSPAFSFGKTYNIDRDMLDSLSDKLVVMFVLLFTAVVLFLIRPVRALAMRICESLPLPAGVGKKLSGLVHTVGLGLDSLTDWRLVVVVSFYTALLWLMVAFTLQLMAWGFPGLDHMTFFDGLAVTMLISVAIIIPAAPGYWGLYEVGCIAAIQMLGISADYDLALSYSLTIHFLQMAPIIITGLYYAARANLHASDIERAKAQATEIEEPVVAGEPQA